MASDWQTGLRARLATAQVAPTAQQRGDLFEEMVQMLFESIPGIVITIKNIYNDRNSKEIDICFWNDQLRDGLWFLPTSILVECKNWMQPVGSAEVGWFDSKIRRSGLDFGILFAANGVTGDAADRSSAHHIIELARAEKRRLVVITADELAGLGGVDEMIQLLKIKLTQLSASGTSLWPPARQLPRSA